MGLLRLLLALSVALIHFDGLYGLRLDSGAAAVEAFFVISGFYMYLVLHDKYYAAGVKAFYLARYSRLMPSYLAVFVLTVVVLAATGASHKWSMTWSETLTLFAQAPLMLQAFIVVSNLTIFASDWSVLLAYDGANAAWWTADFRSSPIQVFRFMIIPQGWSLGNELWFYLIAPFVLRHLWRMIAVFGLSVAVLLYVQGQGLPWDPFQHRFTPAILHLFLLGSISCWVWKRWLERISWLPTVGAVGLAFLVALVALGQFLPFAPIDSLHLLVWSTALFVGPIFALTRTSKLDERLGELSYPIYVSHVLALLIAGWALPGPHTAALALVLTLSISFALIYMVERPVDQWRKRLARPKPPFHV